MGQYFDLDNPDQQKFWYQNETMGTRATRGTRNDQPADAFFIQIEKAQYLPEMDRDEAVMRVFNEMINPSKVTDHGSIREGGMYFTMLAMKDIKWKKAHQSDDAARIISSFHDERDSLLSTVFTLVEKDDPEYDKLYQMAVTGRCLLDLRRNEAYKTRGVKQGFKENKITADGDGFNYYSHVVKLYTVRMCFFRVGRGSRRVAILDQRTSFL